MLHPVKSKGRCHDVRFYGLQYGLAASSWIGGNGVGDRGARQICVLRQSLMIIEQPNLLACVLLLMACAASRSGLAKCDDETEQIA